MGVGRMARGAGQFGWRGLALLVVALLLAGMPSPVDPPIEPPQMLPESTLEPTDQPEVATTPVPTATLSPSITPGPTATLSPSITPGPTATLSPSMTPGPTTTLSPSVTPSPTVTLAPAASPTTEVTPVRVRVVGAGPPGANFRQAPSTTGRLVGLLRDGAELTVVGENRAAEGRTWRNVRDAEGRTGWMSAELLEDVVPTPAATPVDPSFPCRDGQVKGEAVTGLFYTPQYPSYPLLRERVRCFDDTSRARAAGFQPAP